MTTPPLDLAALRKRELLRRPKCGAPVELTRWELATLLDRVENAEAALVEMKPADVLVEGSWIAVADLPEILGNHMVLADRYARDAKAATIRLDELKADLVRPDGVNPHPYYVGVHDDFPGGNDDDLVSWAFEAGAQWAAWEESRRATEATDRTEAAEAKVAAVRELASPDWCLSVPASVKQAILARLDGGA